MITLEQAQALQPGDRIHVGSYLGEQWEWGTEWEVITPRPHQVWAEDKTIVQYIQDTEGYGIVSYIFSNQLHRYRLGKKVGYVVSE